MATDDDMWDAQNVGGRGLPVIDAGANNEIDGRRSQVANEPVGFDDDVPALRAQCVNERGRPWQRVLGSTHEKRPVGACGQVTPGLGREARGDRILDEGDIGAGRCVPVSRYLYGDPRLGTLGV
jgi:hypothetical protein